MSRKNQELNQLKSDELNTLKRQNVELKRKNVVLEAECERLRNITVTNSRLLRYGFT